MPGEITLGTDLLFGFLLCLSRMLGVLMFIPIPGMKSAPDAPRIVFALALTMCLRGFWPAVSEPNPTALRIASLVLAEAVIGMGAGLAVSFLLEAFNIAAQVFGLQAGYSYASTIDPSSQADSGVLQVWSQLLAAFLFFAAGLDRQVVRALAGSMAGQRSWSSSKSMLDIITRLGTEMFSVAVRLAIPVVIFLLLLDVALALSGRLQAQFQLVSLAFPAKMLVGLVVLGIVASSFPAVIERAARLTFDYIPRLMGA